MTEIWKDVPDYVGIYQASNTGKIKSNKKGILTGTIDRGGYIEIGLKKNGVVWKQRRSRIIYRTFSGETITSDDVIHHLDEDKHNDAYSNLKKTNRSEHKSFHPEIGEKTRFGQKYDLDKVEIKELYKTMSSTAIAGLKGCSGRTILRIINSET